jgi:hypothetical protein
VVTLCVSAPGNITASKALVHWQPRLEAGSRRQDGRRDAPYDSCGPSRLFAPDGARSALGFQVSSCWRAATPLHLDRGCPIVRRPQRHHLGTGVGDADDGVQELALEERASSTSKPSPTKNADTTSRSATVMPTWPKPRIRDMRCTLSYPVIAPGSHVSIGQNRHVNRRERPTMPLIGAAAYRPVYAAVSVWSC